MPAARLDRGGSSVERSGCRRNHSDDPAIQRLRDGLPCGRQVSANGAGKGVAVAQRNGEPEPGGDHGRGEAREGLVGALGQLRQVHALRNGVGGGIPCRARQCRQDQVNDTGIGMQRDEMVSALQGLSPVDPSPRR